MVRDSSAHAQPCNLYTPQRRIEGEGDLNGLIVEFATEYAIEVQKVIRKIHTASFISSLCSSDKVFIGFAAGAPACPCTCASLASRSLSARSRSRRGLSLNAAAGCCEAPKLCGGAGGCERKPRWGRDDCACDVDAIRSPLRREQLTGRIRRGRCF
jgi:hypothetical protein